MNRPTLALLACLLPLAGAHAAPAANEPAPTRADERGADTAAWLEIQRTGNYAGKPSPMPGDATSRAYQRYLQSFEAPIPEHFEDRSMTGR
ncbi:MAG: DUF3613 domain-containing protein [Gammaproteobacteria bacterium]|nr:DUF3613 domain-containing protein [Gammaproteobacteria bacterium]